MGGNENVAHKLKTHPWGKNYDEKVGWVPGEGVTGSPAAMRARNTPAARAASSAALGHASVKPTERRGVGTPSTALRKKMGRKRARRCFPNVAGDQSCREPPPMEGRGVQWEGGPPTSVLVGGGADVEQRRWAHEIIRWSKKWREAGDSTFPLG